MKSLSAFSLLAIFIIFLPSCSPLEEGVITIKRTTNGTVKTTVRNSWRPQSKAIIKKGESGWEFRDLIDGGSIVVNLKTMSKWMESFDGVGYHEIAFQLPQNIEIGKNYELKSVPKNRKPQKINDLDNSALLRDGELVAFEFSNPVMGWLASTQKSSVRVISMTDQHVVVHFFLKGKGRALGDDGFWDFDYDEKFTVNITNTKR